MDSFSLLPDEVLVHIISFLDTKGSVSTSILAKRWRFLWASVSRLCFASDDYLPETRARLSSIINRTLLLHQGNTIEHFCLYYRENEGISNSELETWVAALITCNVREVTLLLKCDAKLPQSLFTCKTLVNLDLTGCGHIPAVNVTVYLPALKILSLLVVQYECEESLQHLISGCPVLEELTIWTGVKFRCSISSATIKDLWVGIGNDASDDGGDHERYFSIGTLTSLVVAAIGICCRMDLIGDDISYFHYVMKIVGKVCDVRRLTLSTSDALMIGVPNSAFSSLTIKFRNLTVLSVASDWRFVTMFLERADNLQDLTIRIDDTFCCLDWVEPDKVAACLVSCVRFVRFDWSVCFGEEEFEMVRYILRNALVLKRMTIQMNRNGNNKKHEEVKVQIQSFERGSEACEIDFEFGGD